MNRKEELQAGLERTRAQIEDFARAAGREAPQLLPVTKFHPAGDVALLARPRERSPQSGRECARALLAVLPCGSFIPPTR